MEDEETCNTRLSLGLGMGGCVPILKQNQKVEAAISNRQIDEGDEQSDHNNNSCRKKLRLTKEQSAMLEDSFEFHTSLNPVQKQELAQQLDLKPRQVEVWFQNRRARRKVKQREVEWEMWKKCWENAREENRRLKKEVEELKLEMATCSNNKLKVAICSWCKKPLKMSPINIHANAKP